MISFLTNPKQNSVHRKPRPPKLPGAEAKDHHHAHLARALRSLWVEGGIGVGGLEWAFWGGPQLLGKGKPWRKE